MFRFDLIAETMEKEPNKFLLVHVLSKRMHQLADGATPLTSQTNLSLVNMALQEFVDGSISLKDENAEAEK